MKKANAVVMLTLSALIAFPAISSAVTDSAKYVNGLQVTGNVGGGGNQSNPGESVLDQDSSSPMYDLCVFQQEYLGNACGPTPATPTATHPAGNLSYPSHFLRFCVDTQEARFHAQEGDIKPFGQL